MANVCSTWCGCTRSPVPHTADAAFEISLASLSFVYPCGRLVEFLNIVLCYALCLHFCVRPEGAPVTFFTHPDVRLWSGLQATLQLPHPAQGRELLCRLLPALLQACCLGEALHPLEAPPAIGVG